MKSILLVGGGGHCYSCIDAIESIGVYNVAGIVTQSYNKQEVLMGYSVIGVDEDLPKLFELTKYALVTVGQIKSSEIRRRLFDQLKKIGYLMPTIKSSTTYCSSHAIIGDGTILLQGSVINAKAVIGSNCIINSKALIEHDAEIADHCHISTGAIINGGVRVGKGSFVGSGAVIREGVQIGAGALVSAGQIVMNDVPDGEIVWGRRD